ncbi:MAG: hybrid sensor histidine kinase/response regulator [Ignavibacteriales bacterium]|nr:hybrid sensor histidine kinase/response regulator [Ignavibacteriales bacterium]
MNINLRILHLEDNDRDAELIQSKMEMEGITGNIIRVKNKNEFIQQLKNSPFDLILSDNTLPDFNGLSALEAVRERHKNIPFIFLSGTISENIAINSMKYGATDYVLKHNIDKLGVAVKRAVNEYRQKAEIERMHKEIKESEERLRYVNKATNDIIMDIDLKDNKVYWSETTSKHLLYKPDEIGKTMDWWLGKIHPDDLDRLRNELYDFLMGDKEFYTAEYSLERGDGLYIYILHRSYVIRDKEGNPLRIIGTLMDMTERKRFEENLRWAKEKAEQSEKLKSEFLAQMSHEIRTPLNIILNYESLLREEFDIKNDPAKKEILDIILFSGKRLIRTVDSILNMSELQAGTYQVSFKEVDVYANSLKPLYNEYKINADRKHLDFVLNNLCGDTRINTDEYSLTQVFSNLIDNAIKYTENGTVQINLLRDDENHLCVEVADTGIGISEDFRPYIFGAFRQEEHGYTRKYEGSGLGLALVKRYCELIHADIEVDSEKGKGTKFKVRFGTNGFKKK